MASTNRLLSAFTAVFFILVLCGTSRAQSTFFSEVDTTEPSVIGYSVPSPSMVHGFGVTSLSSYYPDSSFIEAYELAVEDLTANLLTSIYLESFITTMLNTDYEFAIRDSIDRESVVKVDSLGRDGKAYFYVSLDTVKTTSDEFFAALKSSVTNWTADYFNPVETERYWIAAGHSNLSRFNPYRSWAESKLNALSSLARLLQTKVQSTTRFFNFFSREITYITSKVIFQNILVLERRFTDERCYTLIAVHKDDINMLE